jgi:hypothetical protein
LERHKAVKNKSLFLCMMDEAKSRGQLPQESELRLVKEESNLLEKLAEKRSRRSPQWLRGV